MDISRHTRLAAIGMSLCFLHVAPGLAANVTVVSRGTIRRFEAKAVSYQEDKFTLVLKSGKRVLVPSQQLRSLVFPKLSSLEDIAKFSDEKPAQFGERDPRPRRRGSRDARPSQRRARDVSSEQRKARVERYEDGSFTMKYSSGGTVKEVTRTTDQVDWIVFEGAKYYGGSRSSVENMPLASLDHAMYGIPLGATKEDINKWCASNGMQAGEMVPMFEDGFEFAADGHVHHCRDAEIARTYHEMLIRPSPDERGTKADSIVVFFHTKEGQQPKSYAALASGFTSEHLDQIKQVLDKKYGKPKFHDYRISGQTDNYRYLRWLVASLCDEPGRSHRFALWRRNIMLSDKKLLYYDQELGEQVVRSHLSALLGCESGKLREHNKTKKKMEDLF